MAAKETSARWIDGICTKYTPTETRKWIRDSWKNSVQPEFKRFRAAIADAENDIPQEFFATNGIRQGNKNPLFLFIRPHKILYIAVALEDSRQESIIKILQSYLQEWDECLSALRNRFPENQSIAHCGHLLQRIAEITDSIYDIRANRLEQYWYEDYRKFYFETCDAFADIPTHIARKQQVITAVKDALKLTSDTQPHLQKLLTKAERQESKMDKFIQKKKLEDRQDIIDTYRETIENSAIVYSEYARSIGAECNQTRGTFTLSGLGKTCHISSTSTLPWLVIRLLLKSKDPDGITKLYSGWNGPFKGSKDDKSWIRQNLIKTAGESMRKNNKLFRLISVQELLKEQKK